MRLSPDFSGIFSRTAARRGGAAGGGCGMLGASENGPAAPGRHEGEGRLRAASSSAGRKTLSLRLRLIGLIALVFAGSLALGGWVAWLNASRSVATELDAAVAVARQVIEARLATLDRAEDPRRALAQLVAAFAGNRHLRVTLRGEADETAGPAEETSPIADVPPWFVRLIGVAPTRLVLPVAIAGRSEGSILVETVPHNEILEIWNEFADTALMLALFSLPTLLLTYLFIGHALRPLDRMAAALGRIGGGDYQVRLAETLPSELAPLGDSFNRMADRLAAMDAENRRLNEQLLTLQEAERSDIARDLHDEVGPFLFAINIDAANIARHARDGRLAPIPGLVDGIVDAVGHLQRQVKGLLRRLRPIGLAEFGLADAIANQVEFWRRRHPAIEFRLDIAGAAASQGELMDTVVFRVVQEALSNALRHSRPSRLSVFVGPERGAGGAALLVRVADDGQGIGARTGLGYGLLGMSERVKAMGGSLDMASAPGAGLVVTASLPLPQEAALAS